MHNLGTGYTEKEYGTYEYEKEKDMEKEHINFWYRQADSHFTSRALSLTNERSCHFYQNNSQLLPPLLVQCLLISGPLPTKNRLDN